MFIIVYLPSAYKGFLYVPSTQTRGFGYQKDTTKWLDKNIRVRRRKADFPNPPNIWGSSLSIPRDVSPFLGFCLHPARMSRTPGQARRKAAKKRPGRGFIGRKPRPTKKPQQRQHPNATRSAPNPRVRGRTRIRRGLGV